MLMSYIQMSHELHTDAHELHTDAHELHTGGSLDQMLQNNGYEGFGEERVSGWMGQLLRGRPGRGHREGCSMVVGWQET